MKTILTVLTGFAIFVLLFKLFMFIAVRKMNAYTKKAQLRRKMDLAVNKEIQKDDNFYRNGW